jgi:hypothetical protein
MNTEPVVRKVIFVDSNGHYHDAEWEAIMANRKIDLKQSIAALINEHLDMDHSDPDDIADFLVKHLGWLTTHIAHYNNPTAFAHETHNGASYNCEEVIQ